MILTQGIILDSAPTNDPRYREVVEPNSAEDGKYYAWRFHFRQYNHLWMSLIGLVAAYSIVYNLVKDPTVQSMVKNQVIRLANYLNVYGYILVRPNGGFSFRGASGLLPALQYPFNQFFTRVTGQSYTANTNFEDILKKANVWESIEGDAKLLGMATALLKDASCFDVEVKERMEFAAAYLALTSTTPISSFQPLDDYS